MKIDFFKFIDDIKDGNKNYLIDENSGYTLSFSQLKRNILFFRFILKNAGVEAVEKICLFAENHPNYTVFEQAILSANAVCVPRGAKSPLSELEYIYKDSDSRAIITNNAQVVNHFASIDNLKFILYFGDEENLLPKNLKGPKILKYSDFDFSQQIDESPLFDETDENQIAFILYTSGTSGFPKGAMIKASSINYEIKALGERFRIDSGKTSLCVHPLWHSGARIYNLLFIQSGCDVIYTSFKNYIQSIKKYSPEYLQCVPKSIYTIYEEYKNIISKFNILHKLVFKFCFLLSLRYRKAIRLVRGQNAILPKPNFIYYIQAFINIPILHFPHIFITKFLYPDFRRKLLKDDSIIFTGAAKLSHLVEDFFDVIGIKIIGSYGLTEASPLLTHDKSENQKYYASGFPLMNTEIKIVNPNTFEDLGTNKAGVILAKGPQIMEGYHNKEEDTKKVFLPDGFLKTGDLGWLSDDNYLIVISRYDDTIVLSNGLNVDTSYIEEECEESDFVNQIVLVGNGRPYISALCSINEDNYKNWCAKNKFEKISPNKNSKFKEYLLSHLNEIISKRKNFVPYEKIKNIFFVDEPFSIQNGLMTNTSKLKRVEINKVYMKQIDVMYNNII